jgi:hypothetical protein
MQPSTKYRKKPVVIEARLFTEETKDQVFAWIECTRIPTWHEGKQALTYQVDSGDYDYSMEVSAT